MFQVLHVTGACSTLVITVKPKAKGKYTHGSHVVILPSKIIKHTSLQDPKLTVDSVDPTSKVCTSVMMLLLIPGNLSRFGGLQWRKFNTKFRENMSNGSN
jgi:hypothetical protein